MNITEREIIDKRVTKHANSGLPGVRATLGTHVPFHDHKQHRKYNKK